MNDDEIPVVVDPNCPPNTIYLIDRSAIHHEPLPEWRWEFEDGDQIDFTVVEGPFREQIGLTGFLAGDHESFVRGEE